MDLADILIGRARVDQELQKIIDERTTPWCVAVQSVEIRDIVIPQHLEDATSRQAQAERERQARVILGESEKQIAQSFADASLPYLDDPTALHLRVRNMLFEGVKEKGALISVPSTAVEAMDLGGLSGLVAFGQSAGSPGKEQAMAEGTGRIIMIAKRPLAAAPMPRDRGEEGGMIEVQDLVNHFGSVRAVDGVTFTAREGEVLGLLGPSGAGKATTLRLLSTVLRPSAGTARSMTMRCSRNQIRSGQPSACCQRTGGCTAG